MAQLRDVGQMKCMECDYVPGFWRVELAALPDTEEPVAILLTCPACGTLHKVDVTGTVSTTSYLTVPGPPKNRPGS